MNTQDKVDNAVHTTSLADSYAGLMAGLGIKRYHLKRTLRTQTVAEHSARIVAFIHMVHPNASGNLLRAAILHDVSEIVTGDVPSPVKWNNPVLAAELNRVSGEYEIAHGLRMTLFGREARLLKWADYAEGVQFCTDELRMGNENMLGSLRRYVDAMNRVPGWGYDLKADPAEEDSRTAQDEEVALRQLAVTTLLTDNANHAERRYDY